jgi:hypothetical protein
VLPAILVRREKAAGVGVVNSLAIGSARVRGLSFQSFAFNPDAPDEALVGLEILQRLVVRFDFDRMRMMLTRPEAFRYGAVGSRLRLVVSAAERRTVTLVLRDVL